MNTDLDLLRAFGETRTPSDAVPPADLRRRVLTNAHVRRSSLRRPGLRLAWRLGAIGSVAAAILAAVLVGQTVPQAGNAPAPPSGSGSGDVAIVAPPTAAQVLRLAAQHVRGEPALPARADQFVYVDAIRQSIAMRITGRDLSDLRVVFVPPGRVWTWESVDGSRDGLTRRGKADATHPDGADEPIPGCKDGKNRPTLDRPEIEQECSPYPAYRKDLPTDVDAMVAHVYSAAGSDASPGESPDSAAFQRVSALIATSLPAPPVQALAFEAAARIPGATVLQNVTDISGRAGIAVARTDGGVRTELIFDPDTYAYLGSNQVVVEDNPAAYGFAPNLGLKAGDVLRREAILRVAVVDQAGQTP